MTPEERRRDKAVCGAAPANLSMVVDDCGRIDLVCASSSVFGYDPVAIGVSEQFARFAVDARERWPLNIAEAEEMARRVEEIEREVTHESATITDEWDRAHLAGMRRALRILRGEK